MSISTKVCLKTTRKSGVLSSFTVSGCVCVYHKLFFSKYIMSTLDWPKSGVRKTRTEEAGVLTVVAPGKWDGALFLPLKTVVEQDVSAHETTEGWRIIHNSSSGWWFQLL